MSARQRLIFLAILLATALVYSRTGHFGFIYDDGPLVVTNARVQHWSAFPGFFVHNTWSNLSNNGYYYRPLLLTSFLVDHTLFGLRPAGFHLTNVAFHLLAICMLFLFTRRLLEQNAGRETDDARVPPVTVAIIASALFAFHPIHSEPVAWIAAVNDPIMAATSLAALYCWLRAREAESAEAAARLPRKILWWASAMLFFAVSLLAKEPAAVLPGIVFLFALHLEGNAYPGRTVFRDALIAARQAVAFAPVLAVYLAVRWRVIGGIETPVYHFPPTTYLCTWPLILWFYLRKLVWPVPVSGFYDAPYVAVLSSDFWVPLLLMFAVFAALALWQRREPRLPVIALAMTFLLPIVPTFYFGLFAYHDFLHDRYAYFGSSFGCILLAVMIWRAGMHIDSKAVDWRGGAWSGSKSILGGRSAAILTVALSIAGAVATADSLPQFRDDLSYYAHGAVTAPIFGDVPRMNLANALSRAGHTDEALAQMQVLAARHPDSWMVQADAGNLYYQLGRFPEAERAYAAALVTKPAAYRAPELMMLGFSLMRQGRAAEAEAPLREAAGPANPTHEAEYIYALSLCLTQEGKLREALSTLAPLHGRDPAADARIAELEGRLKSTR